MENTVSNFLVRGMNLNPVDIQPKIFDKPTFCAMDGIEIKQGYPIDKVVPASVGEYIEMLNGEITGYLSEDVARAFKGTWNMGSWLIFESGEAYHPLISRTEAEKQGRPCWSDLVRSLSKKKGEKILLILTTDVKKRVWTRARIGVLGGSTIAYLHDPEQNISNNLIINWENMIEVLEEIESILTLGYNKITLSRSLLSDLKTSTKIGLKDAITLEKKLSVIRSTPEFKFAYVISQKKETKNETEKY